MLRLVFGVGAEARHCLGNAESLGRELRVEFGDEGLVGGAARFVGALRRRARHLGRLFGIGQVGLVGEFTGRRLGRFAGALLAVVG